MANLIETFARKMILLSDTQKLLEHQGWNKHKEGAYVF
ncbi:MAG: hypothetical protein ACJAUP_000858 [Cellvibrionaceae bacterium]|jgi:hypothetical protein